jgi:hypothetical protein
MIRNMHGTVIARPTSAGGTAQAGLAALSRLFAQRGITERDDILCILNVLCAQEAD